MDSNCFDSLSRSLSSIPSIEAIKGLLLRNFIVDSALFANLKRSSKVSGSLSRTFSAMSVLKPFAIRLISIRLGMLSSHANC